MSERWTKATGVRAGAAVAVLLAAGVAWAAVPPDFTVTVTDEAGEPIPDITISVDIPRKAKKPKRVVREMPRKPRRNRIGDNAKKIVKLPPRKKDVSFTFPVPRDADCRKPLRVRVKMKGQTIAVRQVPGWCEDGDRQLVLRLAPSPFYAINPNGETPGEDQD